MSDAAADPDERVLHLWTDDTDTVVALDVLDAAAVWKESMGSSYWEECGDSFQECFRRLGPDEVVAIRDEDGGNPVAKRAKEWAESNGRGFLCSTEY